MPTVEKMKPVHVYVPITRAEQTEAGFIVEGHCYVNPIVEANGINLKRSAMEAASDDYMKWANVRAMHGSTAVGTADADGCGVTWDDKGAHMRALIVDADAIEKCKTKVYKGFSVGVKPSLMRGKDVEKCTWFETSLVDRPADPDCPFTIARAEGVSDATESEDIDVQVLAEGEELPAAVPPVEQRAKFSDMMASAEPQAKRGLAFSVLSSSLRRIRSDKATTDKQGAARDCVSEFGEYIAPLMDSADDGDSDLYYYENSDAILARLSEVSADAVIMRTQMAGMVVPDPAVIERIAGLEKSVADLTTERDDAIKRGDADHKEVIELRKKADPNQIKPVVTDLPAGFRPAIRTFAGGGTETEEAGEILAEITTEEAKIKDLIARAESEDDEGKRQSLAIAINVANGNISRMKSALSRV